MRFVKVGIVSAALLVGAAVLGGHHSAEASGWWQHHGNYQVSYTVSSGDVTSMPAQVNIQSNHN